MLDESISGFKFPVWVNQVVFLVYYCYYFTFFTYFFTLKQKKNSKLYNMKICLILVVSV